MFEQDYLMKLLLAFTRRCSKACDALPTRTKTPKRRPIRWMRLSGMPSGWTAPAAVADPESVVGVLQVSGTDSRVTEFIARSLLLSSEYLTQAKQGALASLRVEQARAIADAYGIDLPDDPTDLSDLKEMAEQANA